MSKLNETLEITDDDVETDFFNLEQEPLNMSEPELKSKTAELYGVQPQQLDFSLATIRELYNLKVNYTTVSFNDAVSCICR